MLLDLTGGASREETGASYCDAQPRPKCEHSALESEMAHFDEPRKRRRPALLTRLFGVLTPTRFEGRTWSANTVPLMHGQQDQHATDEDEFDEATVWHQSNTIMSGKDRISPNVRRVLLAVPLLILVVWGLQLLAATMVDGMPFFGAADMSFHGPGSDWDVLFPTYITRDVKPLPCHSHNDYWHRLPLYEALYYGCDSIEADVWLTDSNQASELHIGHTMRSLRPERTLRMLYLDPLLALLDAMNPAQNNTSFNGVFETAPSHSLILTIDIKNNPALAFSSVSTHLQPFRDKGYLTHHNGTALIPRPLTIVATGSTPFACILAQNGSNRDIFFDAPLADLHDEDSTTTSTSNPLQREDYNPTNSLYASASLRQTLGTRWPLAFFPWTSSTSQLERVRSATRAAHAQGLKVRWWDTPAWPRSWREKVWRVLVEEGADVLNVDDLKAARDWEGWGRLI